LNQTRFSDVARCQNGKPNVPFTSSVPNASEQYGHRSVVTADRPLELIYTVAVSAESIISNDISPSQFIESPHSQDTCQNLWLGGRYKSITTFNWFDHPGFAAWQRESQPHHVPSPAKIIVDMFIRTGFRLTGWNPPREW
jgi:hypothetical protein